MLFFLSFIKAAVNLETFHECLLYEMGAIVLFYAAPLLNFSLKVHHVKVLYYDIGFVLLCYVCARLRHF